MPKEYFECLKCGYEADIREVITECPNCGADIDKEEGDDNDDI